jgi:hypothetical protein
MCIRVTPPLFLHPKFFFLIVIKKTLARERKDEKFAAKVYDDLGRNGRHRGITRIIMSFSLVVGSHNKLLFLAKQPQIN